MTKKKSHWIPWIIFLLIGVLLVMRAQYGLDLTDESYYLAVAKRFWSGDRPFREEWYTSQLIGVVLLPVYTAYVSLTGGIAGLLLFNRILYVLLNEFTSILLYRFLLFREKLDRPIALLISISFLFYVRANIITLSYYSIGLNTFLLYLIWKDSERKILRLAGGIAFSISVLCMPYLAIYFCGSLLLRIKGYRVGNRTFQSDIWHYIGIGISAGAFLGFCISQGDFEEILRNMPAILNDPTHDEGVGQSLRSFLQFMITVFYRFLFLPFLLETAGVVFYRLKKEKSRCLRNILCLGAYLLFALQAVYLRTFFEGGIIVAFLVLAMHLSILEQIQFQRLWLDLGLPGILFGLIWVLGSNTGQRVFNMGALVAFAWAAAVVYEHGKDYAGIWGNIASKLACFLTVAVLVVIRLCDVYRDVPPWKADTKIEIGAAKGIYTSAQRAEEYIQVKEALDKYAGSGQVFAAGGQWNPWLYLEADARSGVFTVSDMTFEDERNELYYERYPEMIPNVVFLLQPDYGAYTAWRFSSHGSSEGYGAEHLDGWIKNLVEEDNYECIITDCGRFYIKGQ